EIVGIRAVDNRFCSAASDSTLNFHAHSVNASKRVVTDIHVMRRPTVSETNADALSNLVEGVVVDGGFIQAIESHRGIELIDGIPGPVRACHPANQDVFESVAADFNVMYSIRRKNRISERPVSFRVIRRQILKCVTDNSRAEHLPLQ